MSREELLRSAKDSLEKVWKAKDSGYDMNIENALSEIEIILESYRKGKNV